MVAYCGCKYSSGVVEMIDAQGHHFYSFENFAVDFSMRKFSRTSQNFAYFSILLHCDLNPS